MTRSLQHAALMTLLPAALLSACGAKNDQDTGTPAPAATADSGITVTADQRGQIVTVPVAKKSFSPTIFTTGTVNFNGDKSTQVIAAISGPVQKLLADVGDSVHAGQPLATVASPDFASAVADVRKAEAALRNAQRIASLDEKLFAGDAISRAELDQAKSDLAAAEADREASAQALVALGVDSASIELVRQGKPLPMNSSVIRSPISGIIVERLITPGQLLQAGGSPAFTIADLSSLWVMGNVFESDAGSVFKGEPVMMRIEGVADSFPGRIDYVGAMVNPDSKALSVRIVADNRRDQLKQNMLLQVEIRGARPHNAVVIPVSAVLRDDDNLPFVFLDAGNNRFLRRRIALGGRTGDVYEVTSGLAAGDKLVTQGALYLQEAGAQ